MIAVRIFKKLEAPVANLPELDPLVGKLVQMIAMEEEEPQAVEAPPPQSPAPPPPAERPMRRQRVRICGMIDRVSDNGDTFRLAIDQGATVPCTWAAEGPSPAIGANGHRMAIAGTGVFDDSGALFRIDVKGAAPAQPSDGKFARFPVFGEDEPAEWETSQLPPSLPPVEINLAPAIPLEPPRPALSAATSFTAIFGNAQM